MITESSVIRWIYDRGHFWGREETKNVSLEEVPKLTFADRVVKEAIASMQLMHLRDLNNFSVAIHQRTARPDGDAGPATLEMVESFESPDNDMFQRCPIPDFPPPPGSSFHYDDPDLQQVVEGYQRMAEAAGTGSWPAGCWDGYSDIHRVVIAVDDGNMPSHVRSEWEWIKARMKECNANMGLLVDYVPAGERADVRMKWKVLAGSTIGLAQFPNGRCDDEVFHYLDPGYSGSRTMQAILHTHEGGHNWGLSHSRGGIMNPSIISVPLSWRGDPREDRMKQFFGGVPVSSGPSPEPPSPPEPQPEVEVEVTRFTDAGRQYIIKRLAGVDERDNPLPPIIWS